MSSLLQAIPDHKNYTLRVFEKFEYKWHLGKKWMFHGFHKNEMKSGSFPDNSSSYSWFLKMYRRGNSESKDISFNLCFEKWMHNEILTEFRIILKHSNFKIYVTNGSHLFCNLARSCEVYLPFESIITNRDLDICVTMHAQIRSGTSLIKGITEVKNMRNLLSSLLKGDFADVIVKVGDEEIKCHKCILSYRTSYFDAMFKSGLRESEGSFIEITDFDKDTIKSMINFLYTFEYPKSSVESAMSLLEAANKYQISDLKDACEEHLMSEIDSSNAVDILLHADIHVAHLLKKQAMDYINKNFNEAEQYKPLMTRPELFREIMFAKVNPDSKFIPI